MIQKEYTRGHGGSCGCSECLVNWMYEQNPNQLFQWEQECVGYEGIGCSIRFTQETLQILEPKIKKYLQSFQGKPGQELRHRFYQTI